MAILLTKSYQEVSRMSMTYGELVTYAKYSAQDKETNTTTYQLKTVIHMDYYSSWSFDSANAYLDDAHKVYGYTTFYRGDTTIQEITRTKEHNIDGSSPTVSFYSGFYASYGGGTESRPEIIFPAIQRYAIATNGTNFNDEGNPTLTFTNVGLYPLKAKLKVGSTEIYAENLSDQTATSYTYSLTTNQRNQLRQLCTGQSMTVTLLICSMNGNTVLYESTATVTMTIINAMPTCTHSEVELNQNVINVLGTNNANTVVQSVSNIRITVTPVAYKSASIKRVRVLQDGTSYTKAEPPFVFDRLVRNGIFNIEVVDTRDFTSTTSFQKTLISYNKVKINSVSFIRQSQTSSNIVVNLNADYTQTNFNNTANVPTIKWKLNDGSWATIPSSAYNTSETGKLKITNYVLSNVLVYTSTGYFSIEVSDLLTSATENDILVIKGVPTFDYGEHDVKINGKLYIADEDGLNPQEVSPGGGDPVPINAIMEYSGSSVPDGYEVVSDPDYSTSETKTGAFWIDNKPIYRKVLTNITTPSSADSWNTRASISNVDTLVKLDGFFFGGDGRKMSINHPEPSYYMCTSFKNGNIEMKTASNWTNKDCIIIVEYTKTTD